MVRELKHTEIGDIPVDWELQTFDETFRVLSNNTLSRENLNNRGGAVRNIHYGDILTKFPEVLDCKEEIPYVNDLSLLSSSTQLLQDGDIVIADTAEDETVGKVTEVQNLGDSKLVAGLHTIPCRVKKGDFAPGWLGYYMNSNLFHNQILPYITGIKVSSISKGAISETLILVPPFDEQEKIVQSLNEVQLLMTAETKVVNKMKFVKNGCLSRMFPQKDATVPEMRLPGFTDAWEQHEVLDLLIQPVTDGPHETPELVNEGIPFISVDAIVDNKIDFNRRRGNISKEYDEVCCKKYKPQLHDVYLVKSGSTVGKVAIVETTERFNIWSPLAALRCGDKTNPYFLYDLLQTKDLQAQVADKSSNGTQPNLSMRELEKFLVTVPGDLEEQEKIGDYFSNLDHLITIHQRKCDKYSSIKKGMMSDLLTGKIRLV